MIDKPDAKKAAMKARGGLLALADATNQLASALADFNKKYVSSSDGSNRKINQDYNEPTERNSNE